MNNSDDIKKYINRGLQGVHNDIVKRCNILENTKNQDNSKHFRSIQILNTMLEKIDYIASKKGSEKEKIENIIYGTEMLKNRIYETKLDRNLKHLTEFYELMNTLSEIPQIVEPPLLIISYYFTRILRKKIVAIIDILENYS